MQWGQWIITLATMITTSRHEKIMKTFSRRLKQARKDAGWRSAEKFAASMGLEPHTYRKYEAGRSEPNFEILLIICESLKISTAHLLPLEGEGSSRPLRQRAAA